MSEEITDISEALAECERIIARGFQCFVDAGIAMRRIRNERLYRKHYSTFEEYCLERWDFGRNYVNRLIQAAGVVENLVPIGTIPETESQARPLTQLEPEQQCEAWSAAVERSETGHPTAREVEAVVREMKPKPTRAEIDAEQRAREAEEKLEAVMSERRAEQMRRYGVFRRLIESTELLANFHMESVGDIWDGVYNAGGNHFMEDLRKAIAFLVRVESEHPNKNRQPGLVVSKPQRDSA